MNRMRLLLALPLAGVLAAAGCRLLPEGPSDDRGTLWNPTDTEAPAALRLWPVAMTTGGPANGAVVTSDQATFSWAPNVAGVSGYVWRLDGDSTATIGTSATLAALDEGPHTFDVAAIYPTGMRTPADSLAKYRRTFTVRSFTKPAVYLRPRLCAVPQGGQFAVELAAAAFAKVDTERVKGVHAVLRLPAGVTYVAYEPRGFLTQGGGDVFGWAGMEGGDLVIDIARVGAQAASPADTGAVARLVFQASSPAAADSIRLVRCEARNARNYPLRLTTRGAKTVRR